MPETQQQTHHNAARLCVPGELLRQRLGLPEGTLVVQARMGGRIGDVELVVDHPDLHRVGRGDPMPECRPDGQGGWKQGAEENDPEMPSGDDREYLRMAAEDHNKGGQQQPPEDESDSDRRLREDRERLGQRGPRDDGAYEAAGIERAPSQQANAGHPETPAEAGQQEADAGAHDAPHPYSRDEGQTP